MVHCPINNCKSSFTKAASLFEHARKQHRDLQWNQSLAASVGGVACPCGVLCKSAVGVKRHQSIGQCRQSNASQTTSIPVTTNAVNTNTTATTYPFEFNKLSLLPIRNVPHSLQDTFCECVDKLCKSYITNPSDINLFYILCLPKTALSSSTNSQNNNNIKQQLLQYPDIDFNHIINTIQDQRLQSPSSSSKQKNTIKSAKREISRGNYSKALQLLTSQTPIATINDDTINQLQQLHPVNDDIDNNNNNSNNNNNNNSNNNPSMSLKNNLAIRFTSKEFFLFLFLFHFISFLLLHLIFIYF